MFEAAKHQLGLKHGNFEEYLRDDLGMSVLTFRQILNRKFEAFKKAFQGRNDHYTIHISSHQRDRPGANAVIELTGQDLRLLCDDAWDRIRVEVLEPLLTPDTRHLIIAGGLLRNHYLRRLIMAWAKANNMEVSVNGGNDYDYEYVVHQPSCEQY